MFSLKLKELREHNNLSQQELADILNLSQSTIATWESSKKDPMFITRLKKIAKVLNTDINTLTEYNYNKVEYATDKEKELLKITQKLNEKDVEKIIAYAEGRADATEELKTANKFFNN